MGLVSGREYNFLTLEENGRKYICIDCGTDTALEDAIRLIEEKGLKVTE